MVRLVNGSHQPPPTNCGGRPIITQVGHIQSVASFHIGHHGSRIGWFGSSGLVMAEAPPHAILGIRPSSSSSWLVCIRSGPLISRRHVHQVTRSGCICRSIIRVVSSCAGGVYVMWSCVVWWKEWQECPHVRVCAYLLSRLVTTTE